MTSGFIVDFSQRFIWGYSDLSMQNRVYTIHVHIPGKVSQTLGDQGVSVCVRESYVTGREEGQP